MTEQQPGEPRKRGRPSTGAREAILQAATDVLQELGMSGLATKEIARRAGVAESSIFYHFKDRNGLLQAIVGASLPGFAAAFASIESTDDAIGIEDQLTQLLEALEAHYVRVIPVLTAILSDPELLATFTRHEAKANIGPHRAVPPIADHLRGEQQAGHVRKDADADSVALMIVGASYQRAMHRALSPNQDRLPAGRSVAAGLAQLLAP